MDAVRLTEAQLHQIRHRASGADLGAFHSVLLAQQDRAALLAHADAIDAELAELCTRMARVGVALMERAQEEAPEPLR